MRRLQTTYKGHEILIEAGVFRKRLFIDGKLMAISRFSASTNLVARIEEREGAGEFLIVKI